MTLRRLRTHRVLGTLLALVLVHLVPVHALCGCPETEGALSCCEAMAANTAPAPAPAKDGCCGTDAASDTPALGNAPCVMQVTVTEAPAIVSEAPTAPAPALAPASTPTGVCLPCEVCPFRVVTNGSPPPPTTAAYLLHAAFLI